MTQPEFFNEDGSPNYLQVADTHVHEGQHAYDAVHYKEPNGPTTVAEERRTEQNAYGTEAIFAQAVNLPVQYTLVNGNTVYLTPSSANAVAEGSVKLWQNWTHVHYGSVPWYTVPGWLKTK